MFKIASWNVNSLRVRLPQVLDWIDAHQPDLLGLQETKLTDENFPVEAIHAAGYEVAYSGQKTYNGVAILSKVAATEVVTDLPGLDDPQRRVLAATFGDLRLLNLYVVNGQAVGTEKFDYKLRWLEALRAYVEKQAKRYDQLVLIGDFNIAPEDRDCHDPKLWRERVLCSTPERNALKRILEHGLRDTFRLFEQEPNTFSWWDYRAAGFRRNLGLRIDLILASKALAGRCTASYVDQGPRRLEQPSDHAPVMTEFNIE